MKSKGFIIDGLNIFTYTWLIHLFYNIYMIVLNEVHITLIKKK